VLTAVHRRVSRQYVKPAIALVRLACAESGAAILPPQRVPAVWRPWFCRLTGAFAASRADLAGARAEIRRLGELAANQAQDLERLGALLTRTDADAALAAAIVNALPSSEPAAVHPAPTLPEAADDGGLDRRQP